MKNKLGHSAFFARLLEVKVAVTEVRRQAGLERFGRLPAPWRVEDFDFDAQPSVDRKMIEELANVAVLGGRHQRASHRAARCRKDDVGRRFGPSVRTVRATRVRPRGMDRDSEREPSPVRGKTADETLELPGAYCQRIFESAH
jgi:hypothetical protein